MLDIKTIAPLLKAFPNSFVNGQLEFISDPKSIASFSLETCETELDIKCKVLEWLSRAAYKSAPFDSKRKNDELHYKMLAAINRYLGTGFETDGIDLIYSRLGNNVNRALCVKFVESGYDMNVLERGGSAK